MDKHVLQEELARINMQIVKAKNVLMKVHAKREEFYVEREKEAVSRVEEVLKASQNALDAASENLKELEGIRNSANNLLGEVEKLQIELDSSIEEGNQIMADFNASADQKIREINNLLDQSKADLVRIRNEKGQLDAQKLILEERARKVQDERLQLLAAKKSIS